jgi:hypothetical protein
MYRAIGLTSGGFRDAGQSWIDIGQVGFQYDSAKLGVCGGECKSFELGASFNFHVIPQSWFGAAEYVDETY